MFLVSFSSMSLQVIIRIFLYSICISGFWYQTINISIDFFKYSVKTKIQQSVPNQVGVNNFAIWERYADLILGKEFIDSRATVNGFLNNNTIADIFKKALRKDTIIESCVVHNHDSFAKVAKDRSTNDVAFFLGMASTPDTIIQSDPAMSSTQYVLYLMSLAGSWFGVSIAPLNPYGLWNRFKGRNVVSSVTYPMNIFTYVNISLSLRDRVMKEKISTAS